MINWRIEEAGFDPENIASNGNKFIIGNGYMGVRGTLEEFKKEQLAAVNLAGIYDRVGDGWREPLNAPNGLYTTLRIDEEEYSMPESQPLYHTCSLDYRKALFSRKTIWKTARGQVEIESERFASLANPHLIVMKYCVTANFHADIELITGIDGDVWDIHGPHYDNLALSIENDSLLAKGTTHENKDKVYVAESYSCDFINEKNYTVEGKRILRRLSFITCPGDKYTLTKWIAVYTSKDKDCCHDEKSALKLVTDDRLRGYELCKKDHINKWEEKWSTSEVIIEGDDAAMEALNYSLYHLHLIAPRHSDSMSIAARGLSGQTYKGAVFWDTEMFMLDFFIFTEPEVAKTLLRYRIDTLDGALAKARHYGFDGAFYAWESQEGGFDACSDYNVTDVFTGRPMRTYFKDKQVHISSAIVYGLMKYVDITGDDSLLWNGGFKVIIECAKFYYSLLLKQVSGSAYEIRDVIGPDEYHERVNNNGYTNRMAKYTFDVAVYVLELLDSLQNDSAAKIRSEFSAEFFRGEKFRLVDLKEKFRDASTHIYIPEPGQDGVIQQFDGYNALEDTTPDILKGRLLHEKEYWGGAYGVASDTKVIKQADVVAWLAMFPKDFPVDIMLANWNYYEPRTEHGSSLSACMYALLACRCDFPDLAYPFFLKSAKADLVEGGKQWAGLVYIGGTHPAAQGGAYMTAIRGFGGIYFEDGVIKAKPQLPSGWRRLRFKLWSKGHLYLIDITTDNLVITTVD